MYLYPECKLCKDPNPFYDPDCKCINITTTPTKKFILYIDGYNKTNIYIKDNNIYIQDTDQQLFSISEDNKTLTSIVEYPPLISKNVVFRLDDRTDPKVCYIFYASNDDGKPRLNITPN